MHRNLLTASIVTLAIMAALGYCASSISKRRSDQGETQAAEGSPAVQDSSTRLIQRRINVTETISGRFVQLPSESSQVLAACQKVSIDNKFFDALLSRGIKVISSSEWREPADYLGGLEPHYCNGKTYILEGPSEELNAVLVD